MGAAAAGTPHFPQPVLIDAYGNGGFRFAEMSHRGSLICLPDGIWAWPVQQPSEITRGTLAAVFAQADLLDTLLIGSGTTMWPTPALLRQALRDAGVTLDVMQTGPAIRTYNIMLAERRRVAAALIAVA
jgi:uncharacterized protein